MSAILHSQYLADARGSTEVAAAVRRMVRNVADPGITFVTGTATALKNVTHVCTLGTYTVTLPASPSNGDEVMVVVGSGTSGTITVSGGAFSETVTAVGQYIVVIYDGTTSAWVLAGDNRTVFGGADVSLGNLTATGDISMTSPLALLAVGNGAAGSTPEVRLRKGSADTSRLTFTGFAIDGDNTKDFFHDTDETLKLRQWISGSPVDVIVINNVPSVTLAQAGLTMSADSPTPIFGSGLGSPNLLVRKDAAGTSNIGFQVGTSAAANDKRIIHDGNETLRAQHWNGSAWLDCWGVENDRSVNLWRLATSLQTDHVAGDYVLSAGWGTTASVAVVSGSGDNRARFTVTSAGTGQAANPTITLTFKDGAYAAAPFAVVVRNGGSQLTIAQDWTTSTTTWVMTWRGTPVAAETYTFELMVIG